MAKIKGLLKKLKEFDNTANILGQPPPNIGKWDFHSAIFQGAKPLR